VRTDIRSLKHGDVYDLRAGLGETTDDALRRTEKKGQKRLTPEELRETRYHCATCSASDAICRGTSAEVWRTMPPDKHLADREIKLQQPCKSGIPLKLRSRPGGLRVLRRREPSLRKMVTNHYTNEKRRENLERLLQ